MLTQSPTIILGTDIAPHARWIYENTLHNSPAKDRHGLQHAIRDAIYASVFTNLYKKYGDENARHLKETDIKLLQVAMLFHDSAHRGEEKDLWEKESEEPLYSHLTTKLKMDAEEAKKIAETAKNKDAQTENKNAQKKGAENLHHYLTTKLKVDAEKAKKLAEAVANKDAQTEYLELVIDSNQKIIWKTVAPKPKNLYQKIIHDADCLDIIRAKHSFDATCLDFYQEYVKTGNDSAFEDLARLIAEATRFIEVQGDGYHRLKSDIKSKFEQPDGFASICKLLTAESFPILSRLGLRLLSEEELTYSLFTPSKYDSTQPLTNQNLQAAMEEGRVFARGIFWPSTINKKHNRENETQIETELRKVFRSLGIPTRSKRTNKEGNPNRSVALLGYSGAVFACSGYLLVNLDHKAIHGASANDLHTGDHKKKWMTLEEKNDLDLTQKLQDILRKQKMGGETSYILRPTGSIPPTIQAKHSEIIVDINKKNILHKATHSKYQILVYFSNDPCLTNPRDETGEPYHKNSPELEAIYIQKQFQHTLQQLYPAEYKYIDVIIVEQSSLHNFIRLTPPLTDLELIEKWRVMCGDFMRWFARYNPMECHTIFLDQIKIRSMYGNSRGIYSPADINYSPQLRERLDHVIQEERDRILIPDFNEFKTNPKAILQDNFFYYFYFRPQVIKEVKNEVTGQLQSLSASLAELPSLNIEECIKNWVNDKKSIDPLYRVYYFAEQLQLQKFVMATRQQAENIAEKMIQKIQVLLHEKDSTIDISMAYEALEKLMKTFSIEDKVKRQFPSEEIFTYYSGTSTISFHSLDKFNRFILFLKVTDMSDPENQDRAALTLDSFFSKATTWTQGWTELFFKIAHAINYPEKKCHEALKAVLKTKPEMIVYCGKIPSTLLSDQSFFIAVLDAMSNLSSPSLESTICLLERIQTQCYSGSFSEHQKDFLSSLMLLFFSASNRQVKLIDPSDLDNLEKNLTKFCTIINLMIEMNLATCIPDSCKKILADDYLKLNRTLSEKMKALHTKLPADADADDFLFEEKQPQSALSGSHLTNHSFSLFAASKERSIPPPSNSSCEKEKHSRSNDGEISAASNRPGFAIKSGIKTHLE